MQQENGRSRTGPTYENPRFLRLNIGGLEILKLHLDQSLPNEGEPRSKSLSRNLIDARMQAGFRRDIVWFERCCDGSAVAPTFANAFRIIERRCRNEAPPDVFTDIGPNQRSRHG